MPRKREQRFGGPRDNAQALRITPGCSLAEREGWRPEALVGALRAPGTMVLGGHPGAGLHETQGGLLLGGPDTPPPPPPEPGLALWPEAHVCPALAGRVLRTGQGPGSGRGAPAP